MKDFLRRYSIKNLTNDIHSYGFNYTTKDFLFQVLIILVSVFGVAYISLLKWQYIIALVLLALLSTPFLISAWFKQLYNAKRFTMVTEYLSNIIPIFDSCAKIRQSLFEVAPLCEGMMRDKIEDAVNYIDNNTSDVNAEETALKMIEDEFPNSRIKSVHKMMITIENESSLGYRDISANMEQDVENWIKRTYLFQKDLKDRKNKLTLLCIITLLMNCLFIYLYTSNVYFEGFTDRVLYQISTSVFIAAILVTMIVVITKLHGGWLVNDLTRKDEEEIAKAYDLLQEGKPKFKVVDIVFTVFFILIGGYVYTFGLNFIGIGKGSMQAILIGILFFFMAFMMLMHKRVKYTSAKKTVTKALTIEFPMWLREISLSLNTKTVLNAIESSMTMTSYPMTMELEKFMTLVRENPVSIKPFHDFLQDFDLPDVRPSMYVLFSIQNLNRDEVKKQVAALILRNQEMLDKAEQLQNQDAIAGVETLGYVPIIVFTIQMMFSLFLLFAHMMDKLNATIYDSGVFD